MRAGVGRAACRRRCPTRSPRPTDGTTSSLLPPGTRASTMTRRRPTRPRVRDTPNVISVAATTATDELAPFSNYRGLKRRRGRPRRRNPQHVPRRHVRIIGRHFDGHAARFRRGRTDPVGPPWLDVGTDPRPDPEYGSTDVGSRWSTGIRRRGERREGPGRDRRSSAGGDDHHTRRRHLGAPQVDRHVQGDRHGSRRWQRRPPPSPGCRVSWGQ